MSPLTASIGIPTAPPILTFADGVLRRDGRPHRILAGSLHYFRVHPEQWIDRLERIAALGFNTVDTYIAWNFHQRHLDSVPDFSDWRDLEQFVRLAGGIGLDVIVRPGPYICAEWDNGGLPSWLTGRLGMKLRSSNPPFLAAVAEWFDELVPRLAELQWSRGGPIVALQVENEYGSYGDDHRYMQWSRDALVGRGITELLYTADGPTELMLDGGTLPGILAGATFGSRATEAAALLRSRRKGEPFLCAEFWNGWFDHWGGKHHTRTAENAATTLVEILDKGGSVSVYMAHGGTNFGLWAGANHDGQSIQPTVTSYDSDAPISENGALTPKFFELRDRVHEFTGAPRRPLPRGEPDTLAPRSLPVEPGAALLGGLMTMSTSVFSSNPLSFEELGQASGLVLYQANPRLPRGKSELRIRGLHDRAQVFIDSVPHGVLDGKNPTLEVDGAGARVRLDILVENQGRIHYGPLLGAGKGILGGVQIDRRLVHGWEIFGLPLDEWTAQDIQRVGSCDATHGTTGFATATFVVDKPADTFLAFPDFGKGFVWINGFLLGRYWEIGPQVTLYLPAPLMVTGENTLTVLELEHRGRAIELRTQPELGPAEHYVESF